MWISFGKGNLVDELRAIRNELARLRIVAGLNLEADMATNDELTDISAKLDEAQAELGGLPAEIEQLIAAAGDQADPALVASIKAKADALAAIVPNAPVETPAEPADETPVSEPVDDTEVPAEAEPTSDVVADEPTA